MHRPVRSLLTTVNDYTRNYQRAAVLLLFTSVAPRQNLYNLVILTNYIGYGSLS